MSGGVDSSVTAYLLRQLGLEVQGVYMHNWDQRDEDGTCPSERDWKDVQRVCEHLRISCKRLDFVREYWTEVFDPLIDGYGRGWTPNPDIMCNRHIKFGRLLKVLAPELRDGQTWLATGHYGRVDHSGPFPALLRAKDPTKDQSYFLSSLSSDQLRDVIFPLGNLSKTHVKRIAADEAGMPWLLERKESMGICMVGKRKQFGSFISGYLPDDVIVAQSGKVIVLPLESSSDMRILPGAVHRGHWNYTIGQSAAVAGLATRHYVAHKLVASNTIFVVPDSKHPALFRRTVLLDNWQWCSPTVPETEIRALAQAGYREPAQSAVVRALPSRDPCKGSNAIVEFDRPIRSLALGQWMAVYRGDAVMGGGTIAGLGPWEWTGMTVEEAEDAALRMAQKFPPSSV